MGGSAGRMQRCGAVPASAGSAPECMPSAMPARFAPLARIQTLQLFDEQVLCGRNALHHEEEAAGRAGTCSRDCGRKQANLFEMIAADKLRQAQVIPGQQGSSIGLSPTHSDIQQEFAIADAGVPVSQQSEGRYCATVLALIQI